MRLGALPGFRSPAPARSPRPDASGPDDPPPAAFADVRGFEDGILLVDRGDFFRDVLDGLRERMRQLGSRRVFLGDGSWYWDLKPDFRFGEVVEL